MPKRYSPEIRRTALELVNENVKRQPDGPTNRHKNDPLVRVGYLRQETA